MCLVPSYNAFRLLLLLGMFFCFASCSTQRTTAKDRTFAEQSAGSNKNIEYLAFDRQMARQLAIFQQGGVERPLSTSRKTPNQLIRAASKYMGTSHCMGGTSKRCIDCSGLLFIAFQEIGVAFPRTAEEQARYGRIIDDKSHLRRGDLVFFVRTYKTERLITHSGIYLGDGEFIHTSTSRGVMISLINDPYYWHDKFVFGTRVF